MPNWGNIILTNAGKALEDAVKAGGSSTSINFTKWKLGSGTLPEGVSWETRTDLVTPVMNIPITSSEAQSTGGTLVSGVATNKDLTVGFNMKELGLFATGTDGGEILYGVLVDSNPDYLSAKEGTTVTTVDFSVLIVVDDDLKVTATLSADSLLRLKDLTAHNESATAHAAQFNNTLVDLKTNGNSLRAVKGDGANVDVVVPYAVGTTQANPKDLGGYVNQTISAVRDLLNNELADMNKKGCSVRFIRFGAHLSIIYNNWARNWDATMPPWGQIYGVLSLLSDDTYANVELVGWTGTTVLLQRIAGNWKTAETKVYTNGMLNVADTLKLQNNVLTLDMGGGTQTNINIGQAPKNYSGSGFTYTFYNGKNSLADLVAKTQAVTDNSNNVATTAFVQSTVANKVSQLVNSAPSTLDTINELANALGNDPNFATTVATQIGQKANKTDVDSQIQNVTTELAAHNTNSSAHTPILNAIKAISGMSAYDVAPSKTIAAMIPLLGFGGIVAQKLEENGYIKFANGLIIQWGSTNTVDRGVQITFPIQFSTRCFCGLVTAQKSTGYLEGSQCNPAVRTASTTGMVAIMYDYKQTGWYWLAIGI